jgi:hypothetical protein
MGINANHKLRANRFLLAALHSQSYSPRLGLASHELSDEFVGHLVVRGVAFLFYLLADFHGKVTESLGGFATFVCTLARTGLGQQRGWNGGGG